MTPLSSINHCIFINSQKQSGFFGPPCRVYQDFKKVYVLHNHAPFEVIC